MCRSFEACLQEEQSAESNWCSWASYSWLWREEEGRCSADGVLSAHQCVSFPIPNCQHWSIHINSLLPTVPKKIHESCLTYSYLLSMCNCGPEVAKESEQNVGGSVMQICFLEVQISLYRIHQQKVKHKMEEGSPHPDLLCLILQSL